jgi:hypothetical protein
MSSLLSIFPYMLVPLWIHAALPDSKRKCSLWTNSKPAFTDISKRDLEGCGVVPDRYRDELNATSSTKLWLHHLAHAQGNTCGIALAKANISCPDVCTFLTGQQRQLVDFWRRTSYSENDLAFIELVEAQPMQDPQPTYDERHSDRAKSGFFFNATIASHDRFRGAGLAYPSDDAKTVSDILGQWSIKYGCDIASSCVCLNATVAHAILLSTGFWRYYAFPVRVSLAKGRTGLNLVKPLWARASNPASGDANMILSDDFTWSPMDLQR